MSYADPEKERAYAKAYHATHLDERKAYGRAWRAAHREELLALSRSVPGRFKLLKKTAKQRDLSMTLVLDEYAQLVAANACHYCGFPLPETGHGLDRIDNERGYEPGNVLPCCTECNVGRNDNFTHAEMART